MRRILFLFFFVVMWRDSAGVTRPDFAQRLYFHFHLTSQYHDPMLVMEYMEYGSLYDLLRNETMYAGGDIILQVRRPLKSSLNRLPPGFS